MTATAVTAWPEPSRCPVLVELGATVPARGLYVTEPEFVTLDAAIAAWAKTAVPLIRRALLPG